MKKLTIAGLISTSLLLTACGGSSDNEPTPVPTPPDSTTPPPNEMPTASISGDNSADERTTVTLSAADSTDTDGSIASYEWSVDLGEYDGDQILFTADGDEIAFTFGEIAQDVTFSISLTVTDDEGATNTTSFDFLVNEIDAAKLPPMPANPDEDLNGVDSDDDGVRDDVEIAIYNLFPLSQKNRDISRKTATVYQDAIEKGPDGSDIDIGEISEEFSRTVSCYFDFSELDARQQAAIISGIVVNTPERLAAYESYLAKRSGTTQPLVNAIESPCFLPQL